MAYELDAPLSTLRYKVEFTRSRKSLADRMAVSSTASRSLNSLSELAEGLRAGRGDEPIAESARFKVSGAPF